MYRLAAIVVSDKPEIPRRARRQRRSLPAQAHAQLTRSSRSMLSGRIHNPADCNAIHVFETQHAQKGRYECVVKDLILAPLATARLRIQQVADQHGPRLRPASMPADLREETERPPQQCAQPKVWRPGSPTGATSIDALNPFERRDLTRTLRHSATTAYVLKCIRTCVLNKTRSICSHRL